MKRELFNNELQAAFTQLEASGYEEPTKDCLLEWGREYVNELDEPEFLGIGVSHGWPPF